MKHVKKFMLATILTLMVAMSTVGIAYAQESDCVITSSLGYCDRGYYVPGTITNDTWWREMPKMAVGKATWYSPYIMNATAEWRGMDLTGFLGGVAMMSPADIGEVVWILRPGYEWEGPYLVVDVSARVHMYTNIVKIGEVIEVDFNTALRWGMVSSDKFSYTINDYMIRDVTVWTGLEPPGDWAPPTIVYSEWFLNSVEFDSVYTPNRRWRAEDMKITNYREYQYEKLLAALPPDNTIIQTSNEDYNYIQRIFITLRSGDEVVWFKLGEGSWHGPYSLTALLDYRNRNADPTEVVVFSETIPDSNISISTAHRYTQEYLQTVEIVDEVTWEVDCTDGNVYTGFIFLDYCVPGVISRESWLMSYPKYTVGVATYYAAGVMDTVVENRGMSLKGYVDGIVLMTCGNIGDSVWVRRPGTSWEGPYLVVDCGGPHGIWAFTQFRLHVEVDIDRWNLWISDGGTQQVEVCMGSNNCDGFPSYWGTYWLNRMKWIIPIN